MLRTDLAERWVAALRSGDYTQTYGALCRIVDGDGGTTRRTFCCLGVAADIADRLRPSPSAYSRLGVTNNFGQHHSNDTLPVSLRRDLGIDCDDQTRLIDMNDRDRRTFGEIADWIEAGWTDA